MNFDLKKQVVRKTSDIVSATRYIREYQAHYKESVSHTGN